LPIVLIVLVTPRARGRAGTARGLDVDVTVPRYEGVWFPVALDVGPIQSSYD
jgi:hypothetical protein